MGRMKMSVAYWTGEGGATLILLANSLKAHELERQRAITVAFHHTRARHHQEPITFALRSRMRDIAARSYRSEGSVASLKTHLHSHTATSLYKGYVGAHGQPLAYAHHHDHGIDTLSYLLCWAVTADPPSQRIYPVRRVLGPWPNCCVTLCWFGRR